MHAIRIFRRYVYIIAFRTIGTSTCAPTTIQGRNKLLVRVGRPHSKFPPQDLRTQAIEIPRGLNSSRTAGQHGRNAAIMCHFIWKISIFRNLAAKPVQVNCLFSKRNGSKTDPNRTKFHRSMQLNLVFFANIPAEWWRPPIQTAGNSAMERIKSSPRPENTYH